MKAIMSDELRKIISDPKKNQELREGLNRASRNPEQSAQVSIGDHKYKVKFINRIEGND